MAPFVVYGIINKNAKGAFFMIKIVGFNGSPRKNGNTSAIMKEMLKGAKSKGAEVKFVDLPLYKIENCIGCERCRKDKICTQFNDGMQLLYPIIEEYDGIILGSPTYNYSMTPFMKTFIDRLYPVFYFGEQRPGPYSSRLSGRGKRALVYGVCEQVDQVEMHHNLHCMRDAIRVVGYEIHDAVPFTKLFAASDAIKAPSTLERAFNLGVEFANSFIERETKEFPKAKESLFQYQNLR